MRKRKFTDTEYQMFEKSTNWRSEMNAVMAAYNKRVGTKYKYQFEMIEDLHERRGMTAAEIGAIFRMSKTGVSLRIKTLGLEPKKRGGANFKGPVRVEYKDEIVYIKELAKRHGIHIDTLRARLRTMPMERALTKPVRGRK